LRPYCTCGLVKTLCMAFGLKGDCGSGFYLGPKF
jgi:hypothetical protein